MNTGFCLCRRSELCRHSTETALLNTTVVPFLKECGSSDWLFLPFLFYFLKVGLTSEELSNNMLVGNVCPCSYHAPIRAQHEDLFGIYIVVLILVVSTQNVRMNSEWLSTLVLPERLWLFIICVSNKARCSLTLVRNRYSIMNYSKIILSL